MRGYVCSYDVVVAGGGIAGVAAALAAARRNHRVALVEKQVIIGGLATGGLVLIYLPLCDGNGEQTTFGIAEELLKASIKYSPCDLPPEWGGPENGHRGFKAGKRYQAMFSPAGFTLAMDELLKSAGVDLWLDTLVTGVSVNHDGAISSIGVDNISGHGTLNAKCFVDATGSAALIRFGGGKIFTSDNLYMPWMMEAPADSPKYDLSPGVGVHVFGNVHDRFEGDALDAKTHTAYIRTLWADAREHYDRIYREGGDRHQTFPIKLPTMPQLRKIARIDGMTPFGSGDELKRFEDSVGVYGDWRTKGKVWETPYGALVPRDLGSVLTAGRCIGAADDAWEAFRVIPSAAMTGEIAGTAAALSAETGKLPAELKADEVRAVLRKNGFLFHIDELKNSHYKE